MALLSPRKKISSSKITWISITFIILVYYWWSTSGRNSITRYSPLKIKEISEIGIETPTHNIICIQPYMLSQDYANLEVFYSKIDDYLSLAKEEGLLKENTLVLFPEHIGTPLYLMDEKALTINANSFFWTKAWAISSNFFTLFWHSLQNNNFNFTSILFEKKAEKVEKVFQFVFSSMAKKYNVYILPGSILLPSPYIENGILKSKKGSLKNITAIYQPSGKAISKLIAERNINQLEAQYSCIKATNSTPVHQTSLGNISVLLGDDLWKASHQNKGEILLNPYSTTIHLNSKSDYYFQEIGIENNNKPTITLESCFISRLSQASSTPYVTAASTFLRGEWWGNKLEGKSIIYYNNEIITGFEIEGASIISIGIK